MSSTRRGLATPSFRPPPAESTLPHDARRWALYGFVLGSCAPAGLWLILWVFEPPAASLLPWIYAYTGVGTCIVFAGFGLVAGRLIGKLRDAGFHDPLTGLLNRRFLLETLPRMLVDAQRQNHPLALLMIDLDHFKRVNDTYGHHVGDQTLRAVAQAIQSQLRCADVLARYGGEEFVAVCPRASREESIEIAERLRELTVSLRPHQLGFDGTQSISVGVATVAAGDVIAPEALIALADEAMYRAKQRGRNRVEVSVFVPSPRAP